MSNELAIKQETTRLIISLNNVKTPSELSMILSDTERKLTVKDTLNFPLIAKLETPRKEVIKIIRTIIMNTAKQFQWSKEMGIQEATTLAIDLHEVLRNETIEDIILMFNLVRKGLLVDRIKGKALNIKGRIDNESLFTQIVPAYFELKAAEREKIYLEKKFLKETDKAEITDEQKETSKLAKELAKKMRLQLALKISPPMKRRYLQEKANKGKATSEEVKELEELEELIVLNKLKTEFFSPINQLVKDWINEFNKKRMDNKLPLKSMSADAYIQYKRERIELEGKKVSDNQLAKWSHEFAELYHSNSLLDGIKTFVQFIEFKTF
jgi:hypothetical protein